MFKKTRQAKTDSLADFDDSSDDDQDFKFPTKEELELLPPNMQEALMHIVYQSLRATLVPRIEFILAKRKRRAEADAAKAVATPPSPSFLHSLAIFSKWTNVASVIPTLGLRILHPKEVLVFEGNQLGSVYIVTSGSLSCRQKRPGVHCKGFPDSATTLVRTLDGVRCVGEKVFFTEEISQETIRASTMCTVWVLDKHTYFSHLENQSAERRDAIRQACFATRRDQMEQNSPVSLDMLEAIPLFASIGRDFVCQLHTRLEPRVYEEGRALCTFGQHCSDALIIARGTVKVTFKASSEETFASRGTVWGEVSALFFKKSFLTVVAATTCDVFALSREALVATLSGSTLVMGEVLRIAQATETAWEHQANTRFLPYIERIPFLTEAFEEPAASSQCMAALLESITSCVYPANSTITSASEPCDRIIIPVRGRARITALNQDLQIGEAVGFTCLVPHRWKYHVAAHEPVQTIEISRDNFAKVLRNHRIELRYVTQTRALLYPSVFPDMFAKALRGLVLLCNPPMFSPSQQAVVSSLEPRIESSAHELHPRRREALASNSGILPIDDLHPPPYPEQIDDVDGWEPPQLRQKKKTKPRLMPKLCDAPSLVALAQRMARQHPVQDCQRSFIHDGIRSSTLPNPPRSARTFASSETQTDDSFTLSVHACLQRMLE